MTVRLISIQKKVKQTPAEAARIKALRAKYQKEKPGPEACEFLVPLGEFLELRAVLHDLKKAREAAGMSLADVAKAAGMDKATLSKLENGRQENPTVLTLHRYATAVGKRLIFSIGDANPAGKKTKKKNESTR